MVGIMDGCTQPASISTWRACPATCGRRRIAALGHLAAQRLRQCAAHGLAQAHRGTEQRRQHGLAQQLALGALGPGARHALVDDLAADIDQVPVLHARRAGGLAVAAGQAAVQMLLRGLRGLGAFQHLLDQIDAPARVARRPGPDRWDRWPCRNRSARSAAGWRRPRCPDRCLSPRKPDGFAWRATAPGSGGRG